jgi:hypothetical protein
MQLDNVDVLYVYGLDESILKKSLKKVRFLIFLEDDKKKIKNFYPSEKVKTIFFDNEQILKKLAWDHAFLKYQIISSNGKSLKKFQNLKNLLDYYHLGVHQTVSNYSDFGKVFFENLYFNLLHLKKIRLAHDFFNKFEKRAAIIVSAGPSLDKNISLLKKMNKKALIFAGGSAIEILRKENIKAHFIGAVDKSNKIKSSNIPLFFSSQVSKDSLLKIQGPKILISDIDNFPLEKYIFESLNILQSPFYGGWNVTSFLTKIAMSMGCSPIIFVGLDLSFKKKKYSKIIQDKEEKSSLVEALDIFGNKVYTQKDWLLTKIFLEDLFLKKDIFINATEGGLGLKNIANKSLKETLKDIVFEDVDKLTQDVLCKTEEISIDKKKVILLLKKIEKSILSCLFVIDKLFLKLEKYKKIENEKFLFLDLETEFFYKLHLLPLWVIWEPIIKREMNLKDDFEILVNKMIFFKRILKEHLSITRNCQNQ